MTSRTIRDMTATEVSVMQRPMFDRLFQLYLYDFSERTALGGEWGDVDEEGRFDYWPGLDSYWEEPGRVPLLIRADGRIAGFVLLHQWSALDQPLDRAVAKFFVLRKYRLTRIGTRAAHHVFRRYPGRWEVAVADYNPEALLFWRSAVRTLGAAGVKECAGDGRRWSGTVLRFDTSAAAMGIAEAAD